jgi:hypothetical protein
MLNVNEYVNQNNCLIGVSAGYNPMDGLLPYPYITKAGRFDVSLSGKSNDKSDLSLEQLIELLVDPSRHPSARVRCKPDRPDTRPNGRRIVGKLDWEPLRRRLIAEGVIKGSASEVSQNPPAQGSQEGRAVSEKVKFGEQGYQFDPSRKDERRRVLTERSLRPDQGRFRACLIASSGAPCCAISGCRVATAVQAAHIMPFLQEADNHPENGLLLRADLHLLFDAGLLGIEPDTLEVYVAADAANDADYARFNGLKLQWHGLLSRPALRERWTWFCEQNEM